MQDIRFLLNTHYTNSHALVIGINDYVHASPLSYAVSDAKGIQRILIEQLGFPKQNVTLLTNQQATKKGITKAFFRFTKSDVGLDDRVFVFFAGHGKTLTGHRGEIGFLIPHDANPGDYTSFIRWDDLTRNAELIRAKHVLFIMDACYGGLALTRNSLPGSARFLKDMMLRFSRQVLTAGKADELVADAGGPLPEHSVFTGHLLEALSGKAATEGDIITASSVMAYVYGKVAGDRDSNQTPHYGHLDGDGDFIFKAPALSELEHAERKDLDRLITIPFRDEPINQADSKSRFSRIKTLLATETANIELHDYITNEVRSFVASTSEDAFPVSEKYTQEEFLSRLDRYEKRTKVLSIFLACIAHWAKASHLPTFQKCLARSCDHLESRSGLEVWLELRWYPTILNYYCAGIAAIDANRFDTLAALFDVQLAVSPERTSSESLAELVGHHIARLWNTGALKQIPGHEKHYTPLSEYLFKILQPDLDDVLYLGKNYESAFDKFEMILALSVADRRNRTGKSFWGPSGRFAWKHRQGFHSPLEQLISEATAMKDAWPPIQAGLFEGSSERFDYVASQFTNHVNSLSWY